MTIITSLTSIVRFFICRALMALWGHNSLKITYSFRLKEQAISGHEWLLSVLRFRVEVKVENSIIDARTPQPREIFSTP